MPAAISVLVDVEQDRRGDHAEDVLDVEAAAQARSDLDPARRERGAGRAEDEVVGSDLGIVREAERDQRRTVDVGELLRQLPAPGVADVDRGRRRRRPDEQLPLGREVVLHRRVEVEVILAQVREHERVEANAIETMQRRRVRGRLERDAAVAGVEHLAKRALEVDRLRRRPHDRPDLATDPALDRPEEAGTAARRLEHGVEQEGGRRLPTRAGDAGDLELAGRLAEEDVRRRRHRRPRRRDDELRHLRLDGALDDEDGRAVLDRLGGEVVPVRPLTGNGEERCAGGDGARVVRKVPHLDGVGAAENRLRCERGYKALELHGGERYLAAQDRNPRERIPIAPRSLKGRFAP